MSDAFATFDTFVVIDYRIAVGALRNGSYRTQTDKRTQMVVRTEVPINVYHDIITL